MRLFLIYKKIAQKITFADMPNTEFDFRSLESDRPPDWLKSISFSEFMEKQKGKKRENNQKYEQTNRAQRGQ